jgi:hypothetical protein
MNLVSRDMRMSVAMLGATLAFSLILLFLLF